MLHQVLTSEMLHTLKLMAIPYSDLISSAEILIRLNFLSRVHTFCADTGSFLIPSTGYLCYVDANKSVHKDKLHQEQPMKCILDIAASINPRQPCQ